MRRAVYVTQGPTSSATEHSQPDVTYIDVPAGWIAGFLILTAVIFTVITHRLNRIER